MEKALRVLVLEDDPNDADLLIFELRRAGFAPQWSRVDDGPGLLAGLADLPEIIIADYSLPQLTALDALQLVRESGCDTPVIIVTGVMSEETCVQSLRHGAIDYLLKDRLTRLGPAVQHALAERRMVAARREAELHAAESSRTLQAIINAAPAIVYLTDREGRFILVNAEFERTFGISTDDINGKTAGQLPKGMLSDAMSERDARCMSRGAVMEAEESDSVGTDHRTYLSVRYPLHNDDNDAYAIAVIYTDITRQKNTEAALRAARTDLQCQADKLALANTDLTKLDQLKSQFLSTVSHELRTPLTSIRGYTELLVDNQPSQLTPAEQRMINIIDRNSERLLSLIESLLDFTRIDAGILLNFVEVDLNQLVEGACAAVGTAKHADLLILNEIKPDTPTVHADHDQLERVLLNLLSNAVKFSPAGGTVSVHGSHDDRTVTISVTDCGIGIPLAEQGNIFGRFFRASSAQEHAIKGTGLGLAISRSIVEAHGGQIGFESIPDVRTTFTIDLPIRPALEHHVS
jgi:PAS domain S-box-containing protein